ncbi:Thioesterase/thiol ester dehydrase-isomerase [Annulohypoxylon truncatum]|uniref:Thioesterase/thiol ester dehydrase-isomerase n=1 Tax=Annulohypoxylon truncatum TaxID=327061 RepID=UPI002008BC33|nr:Thioesterase/thiol ester dehydrase-isomerase [Annulohypoxylon truncatum]KAI1211955.1 Thioesterase/thiol ester dehydrase-isomerase [Annulohypoxylon truncatum]
MGEHRPTLVRPPPVDLSKAPIENALELTDLSIIGPGIFTNTRELWHPPGARGIYGGAVIAQTLAAAQRTVPADFVVHSYHCFFVLAGDSSIPIVYYVERVREGRSFCTRTVQARQRGSAIFTVTCSFVRERSGGPATVEHSTPMPPAALANPPPDDYKDPDFLAASPSDGGGGARKEDDPFQSFRPPPTDKEKRECDKRVWQWVRARGKISEEGGHQAHLSALAYISDSFFIGTIPRIHKLWRYGSTTDPADLDKLSPEKRDRLEKLNAWEGGYGPLEEYRGRPKLGMMVSLDHSIYFHNPKSVRADEWMFTEMESPWAGDGRGLVMQRVWSREGVLLATAFQEGVVRLKDESKEEKVEKAKL